MTAASIDLVHRLEDCAARAWPAAHVSDVDGWLLRRNDGVTRRANSVLPNRSDGRLSLAERLARVEDQYRQHGLPARYHMSPASQPEHLDDVLAARGYAAGAHTRVQVAALGILLAATAGPHADRVTVADRLEGRWMATYCRADGFGDREAAGREGILRRIGSATGYALLELDGEPAAVGLGVREAEWVGFYCMATRPEYRRRGAATAVLHALARWGERHAASRAFLQVMEDNPVALALYVRVGFETLYRYHYRVGPNNS
jgi:ribosomal protein S18 acetylase RimI-like enzyme